jgi:hypothetical protein
VPPKFEAEVQQLDQMTYVKVSGIIDEDNDLASLAPRIRGQAVLIDLATVQDINNCGVRDWVKWREELQGRGIAVVLVECSSAVVAKLNSVSNFNDGGFIKSFYLPYYCAACETEKALLVDLDEFRGDGAIKAPTCRCDSCDGIMAFDDMEESYFAFVRVARAVLPPEPLQQLLDHLSPAAGERKILSSVPGRNSSFAGIPSTNSPSGFGTGAGSAPSGPSASQLRRLRDKTGLRTMRRRAEAAPAQGGSSRRLWLVLLMLFTAVVLAGIAVIILIRR